MSQLAVNIKVNTQNTDVINDNIESNPMFVNLANGDFHLQSASLAIDNGTMTLATLDLDGNTIPYPGTAPDIGMYEYQGALNIPESNNINTFVYPNPVKNELFIINNTNDKIEQIVLFDTSGKIVLNKSYTSINSIEIHIDISTLSVGIYIVKVKTTNNNHYIKVIKR